LFVSHAPSTPVIYTLPLHDALPISLYGNYLAATGGAASAVYGERLRQPAARFINTHRKLVRQRPFLEGLGAVGPGHEWAIPHMLDRKSTRLNSSHVKISYAVFCLKK